MREMGGLDHLDGGAAVFPRDCGRTTVTQAVDKILRLHEEGLQALGFEGIAEEVDLRHFPNVVPLPSRRQPQLSEVLGFDHSLLTPDPDEIHHVRESGLGELVAHPDLGAGAAGEMDLRHGVPGLPVRGRIGVHRAEEPDRFVAGQEAKHVEAVGTPVEDVPSVVEVLKPGLARIAKRPQRVHLHHPHFPDAARFDQLSGAGEDAAIAQRVNDAEGHAGLPAGGDHGVAVGHVGHHRLLHQDVLAVAGGGEGLLRVQLVDRRQEHGVDVLAAQHVLVAGKKLDAEIGRQPGRPASLSHPRQLDPLIVVPHTVSIRPAHVSRSHDPQPYVVHGLLPCCFPVPHRNDTILHWCFPGGFSSGMDHRNGAWGERLVVSGTVVGSENISDGVEHA